MVKETINVKHVPEKTAPGVTAGSMDWKLMNTSQLPSEIQNMNLKVSNYVALVILTCHHGAVKNFT